MLRKVLHPQAGFEPERAAVEVQVVVEGRDRIEPAGRGGGSRQIAAGAVIPGPELAEAGPDVADVVEGVAEVELVVLEAEQGVAVEEEGALLPDLLEVEGLMPPKKSPLRWWRRWKAASLPLTLAPPTASSIQL